MSRCQTGHSKGLKGGCWLPPLTYSPSLLHQSQSVGFHDSFLRGDETVALGWIALCLYFTLEILEDDHLLLPLEYAETCFCSLPSRRQIRHSLPGKQTWNWIEVHQRGSRSPPPSPHRLCLGAGRWLNMAVSCVLSHRPQAEMIRLLMQLARLAIFSPFRGLSVGPLWIWIWIWTSLPPPPPPGSSTDRPTYYPFCVAEQGLEWNRGHVEYIPTRSKHVMTHVTPKHSFLFIPPSCCFFLPTRSFSS